MIFGAFTIRSPRSLDIGLLTNLIGLVLFIIQFEFIKLSSFQSQFTSSIIATSLNYILNSKFTFKDRKFVDFQNITKYISGLLITFPIKRLIFVFCYNFFNISSALSYLLPIAITSIVFFFWQKIYVFKR